MPYPYMSVVIAALWLGGLVAIDLVEAPAKFRIKSIARSSAVELGQEVFRCFGLLEIAFSGGLLLTTHISLPALLLSVIAWAVAPLLRLRLKILEAENTSLSSPLKNPVLKKYHLVYILLDIFKIILLSTVLVVGK